MRSEAEQLRWRTDQQSLAVERNRSEVRSELSAIQGALSAERQRLEDEKKRFAESRIQFLSNEESAQRRSLTDTQRQAMNESDHEERKRQLTLQSGELERQQQTFSEGTGVEGDEERHIRDATFCVTPCATTTK